MAGRTTGRETQQPLEVVNFSHPLEASQRTQLAAITGRRIARIIEVPAAIRQEEPLVPQATALVQSVPLSPRDWQTRAILVQLPGLAPLAAAVLAELHGRMGHFPAILRLRPEPQGIMTTYGVAEVINLQELRDEARTRRIPQSAADPTKQPPSQDESEAD